MATDGYANRWNQVEYGAASERRMASALLMSDAVAPFSARGGRRPNGGLGVTVSTSPDQVTVAPGAGVIYDSSFASGGAWVFELTTSKTVTLASRPGAGLSRRDLVIARIYDVDSSAGPGRELKVEVVAGTASATPSLPTRPALSLVLATLTVPSSGSITVNTVAQRTVAAGGILPVATDGERDAITAYPGLTVFNEQSGKLETFDGTSWTGGKPPWVTVTNYASGMSANAFGYPPAYRVWPDGRVDLRGIVSGTVPSTGATTMFTLPTAARPSASVELVAATNSSTSGAVARIEISTTGTVAAYGSGTARTWVSVDGLTFETS